MSQTQDRSLTDFAESNDQDNSDGEQWPVEVNGHSVVRIEPESHAYGSADPDLAFQCEDCGETIRPPEHRAVSDQEWVSNRFSIVGCGKDDGVFA